MKEAIRDWFLIALILVLVAVAIGQKAAIDGQETRIERQRQVITGLVIQLDQTKKQLSTARKNCPVSPPALPPEPLKRSI